MQATLGSTITWEQYARTVVEELVKFGQFDDLFKCK
jgi:hypothetical protein